MAETKGTDGKPSEIKSTEAKPVESKPADTKSGAVKPPVLDLKARDTAAEAAAKAAATARAAEAAKASEASKSTDPKASAAADTRPAFKPSTPPTAPRAAARPGFALGAALTGGVLGLAAAYGLAWFGYWPGAAQPAPQADPRLAQFATAIPELETVTNTTQSELATLTRRVAELEAVEPAPVAAATPQAAPTDLTGIEADLAALGERLDTLAAQPATPPVDTSALTADLAALSTRLEELGARVGSTEAGLRTLDSTVTETSAALASQPSDIGAVLQLPLILSGFETAFATGRPFETELAALRAASPEAAIPTAIANTAATGLTRPDVIAQRFAELLPAMLAGRPADPQAQWQDGALDWFRSAVALRPTGEMTGDTPEAIASRLEGAVARRDFATAETLLAALPQPMVAAAGELPDQIAQQAEAARFLETLRAQALSGEVGQ